MNIASVWLVLFCLLSLPAWAGDPSPITYAGGDGMSFKSAVTILDAKDDHAETHAEYEYLAKRFPHYKLIQQAPVVDVDKYYDRLEFADANGVKHKMYFDITDSFKRLQSEGAKN